MENTPLKSSKEQVSWSKNGYKRPKIVIRKFRQSLVYCGVSVTHIRTGGNLRVDPQGDPGGAPTKGLQSGTLRAEPRGTTYDPRTGPTQPPLTPAGIVPKALALSALRAGVNREGAQSDPLSLSSYTFKRPNSALSRQNAEAQRLHFCPHTALPRAGRCTNALSRRKGTRGPTKGNTRWRDFSFLAGYAIMAIPKGRRPFPSV